MLHNPRTPLLPSLAASPKRWWTPAVLVLASLLALGIALRVQVQFPMPGYFDDIRIWAANGHIEDTFTPLAYPLFAAPVYRVAGTAGIVGLQAVLFVGLVFVGIRLLRGLQLPVEWATFGSLLLLIHPELALSIPKVWDVDLSVFLLLLFVLLCLRLQRGGPGLAINLSLGMALGAAVFCRPNYALLAAGFFFALARGSVASSRWVKAGSITLVGITAGLMFAVLGAASHGSPFLPRNGPYNLFAGHNAFTRAALLDKLNAEPSIVKAFAAAYPPPLPELNSPFVFYDAAYEPFYSRQALLFARQHPMAEVDLVGVKLFTLFRPDTKVHPLGSTQGLVKLVLALPAAIFLLLIVLPRRPTLHHEDWLLITFYVAYVVPFLITNSDPRFRIPLDALLLLHCVRLTYLRRRDPAAGRIASTVDEYSSMGT